MPYMSHMLYVFIKKKQLGFVYQPIKKKNSIKIKNLKMGNTSSNDHNIVYTYETVDEIPEGIPPPSAPTVIDKTKELALYASKKFDPANLEVCRDCLKQKNTDLSRAERIRDELSFYTPENPPYSEKTFKFKLENHPEIWVSSTKNSDSTVSYWLQYPIQPYHIQAAILKCMNIPVTPENMFQISERYKALYTQCLHAMQNEIASCQQVDPLYVDMTLKALVSKDYKSFGKPILNTIKK